MSDINIGGVSEFINFLTEERKALQSKLLSKDEATALVDRLTKDFPHVLGKLVSIACGQQYIIADNVKRSSQSAGGRDILDRPTSGLSKIGTITRFDALTLHDQLLERGTVLTVHEPCIVYEPAVYEKYIHPEPQKTEFYIPLIRTSGIVEYVPVS